MCNNSFVMSFQMAQATRERNNAGGKLRWVFPAGAWVQKIKIKLILFLESANRMAAFQHSSKKLTNTGAADILLSYQIPPVFYISY